MKKYYLLVFSFLLLFQLVLAASNWSIETVDTNTAAGQGSSFIINSSDFGRLVYTHYTGSNHKTVYAKESASGWALERIDSSINHSNYWASLDLDSSENPGIAYTTHDYNIKYGYHNGASWSYEDVDKNTQVYLPAIAFDNSNNPSICYRSGSSNEFLKYAIKSGGTWNIETADSTAGTASLGCGIDFNSGNIPHIAYERAGELWVATKQGGSWSLKQVDANTGIYSQYTTKEGIEIDSSNNVHICYGNSTSAITKYAKYTSSTGNWHVEVIANIQGGGYCSIAIDNSNRPVVSWYVMAPDIIRFARLIGGSWQIETPNVSHDPAVMAFTSIDVNSQNKVRIAFQATSKILNEGPVIPVPEFPFSLIALLVAVVLIAVFIVRRKRK